jgi:hypothetical protein
VIVPRKVAKALLQEFLGLLEQREEESGGPLDAEGLSDTVAHVLEHSTLVLRGSENAEQKARRYLVEGRIQVDRVEPSGLVVATARGTEGTYHLGYDPRRREWRCTCAAPGKRCSHLIALRLVMPPRGSTDTPNTRGDQHG